MGTRVNADYSTKYNVTIFIHVIRACTLCHVCAGFNENFPFVSFLLQVILQLTRRKRRRRRSEAKRGTEKTAARRRCLGRW